MDISPHILLVWCKRLTSLNLHIRGLVCVPFNQDPPHTPTPPHNSQIWHRSHHKTYISADVMVDKSAISAFWLLKFENTWRKMLLDWISAWTAFFSCVSRNRWTNLFELFKHSKLSGPSRLTQIKEKLKQILRSLSLERLIRLFCDSAMKHLKFRCSNN